MPLEPFACVGSYVDTLCVYLKYIMLSIVHSYGGPRSPKTSTLTHYQCRGRLQHGSYRRGPASPRRSPPSIIATSNPRVRDVRRTMASRSRPKRAAQNILKYRCRTTVAERMVETLAELPFIGGRSSGLSHDQALSLRSVLSSTIRPHRLDLGD